MTNTEEKYIDVNKGFRRTRGQPLDAYEKFNSYEEAETYAKNGLFGGVAWIGQTVKVVDGDVKEYLIDKTWNLIPVSSNEHDDYVRNFKYSDSTGTNAFSIIVPAGFSLSTISIKINEAFDTDNCVKVLKLDSTTGDTLKTYISEDEICSDEEDSEYVFKISEIMPSETKICVSIIHSPTHGTGTIKLN